MPIPRAPRTTATRNKSVIAGLLAALLACVPSIATAQTTPEQKSMTNRTVTVSASGTTQANPDMASVSSGVATEAQTAREAMDRNNSQMAKLIDGIKKLGIDAKDIQTASLNLSPRYSNPRDGRAPTITGYTVSNQITVQVRKLNRLGELLDTMVTLGANQVGGVSFEVSNAETLKDEARKAAMLNARRRAELYATTAGVNLGEVLTISESFAAIDPRPQVTHMRSAIAASVPIETGEQTLTATIHVTWALK